jgi:hypothetical protein
METGTCFSFDRLRGSLFRESTGIDDRTSGALNGLSQPLNGYIHRLILEDQTNHNKHFCQRIVDIHSLTTVNFALRFFLD